MNLNIRGVDPMAVKKIDELAKRKMVSRNTYIKQILETSAALDELNALHSRYEQLIQTILVALQDNTNTLQEVMLRLEEG